MDQSNETPRTVATLESAINLLEGTSEPLTPVQLHSLNIVAEAYGVKLGHQQAGLTLEAWTGDRARQMRTLTLDAFKTELEKLKPAQAAE